jgi:hypothetical protein
MSTLSDHRTIIASLFLPTSTAAVFHLDPRTTNTSALLSVEASPVEPADNATAPPPPQRSPTTTRFALQRPGISRHATTLSLSGSLPPPSIIDDLLASQANRTATGSPIATPNGEAANPFASFAASTKKFGSTDGRSGQSTPASQGVSSDTELARGRVPDVRVVEDEESPPGTVGAPMVRRLSRKQSKVFSLDAFENMVLKIPRGRFRCFHTRDFGRTLGSGDKSHGKRRVSIFHVTH